MLRKDKKNKNTDPKLEDSQGPITDADLDRFFPTPNPNVGKDVLRRAVQLGVGTFVVAVAIGGTRGAIDAVHNNPGNYHPLVGNIPELTAPSTSSTQGESSTAASKSPDKQLLATISRRGGLYSGAVEHVDAAALPPQYRAALQNQQEAINNR